MQKKKYNHIKSEKGFSLLELLLAIGIFSFISISIMMFSDMIRKSYNVQNQLAAVENNTRSAVNMMEREIRMAGYHADGGDLINNLSDFVPSSFIPTEPTYPFTVNLDANPKVTLGNSGKPDIITYLAVLDTDNNPTTLASSSSIGSTSIIVNTPHDFSNGDMLHIGTACEYAVITNNPSSTTATITIDTNPGAGGTQGLESAYDANTAIGEISTVTYAVFNELNDSGYNFHTQGHPILKREINGGGFEPVAEDIKDMQISTLSGGEILVTLTGRSEKSDSNYSGGAGDGYRTYELTSKILVRNAETISTGTSCKLPAIPANFSLSLCNSNSLNQSYPCKINMSWDTVTNDSDGSALETGCEVTGYWVYYDSQSGLYEYSVNAGNVTSYELNVSSLQACTYYISVAAYNNGGIGAKASEVPITDCTSPATPSDFAASASSEDNLIELSWTSNTECDLQGYHIYRSTDGGTTWETEPINGSSTPISKSSDSYTDVVYGCKQYYYKMLAIDNCPNNSAYTSSVSTTATDATDPETVTDLSHSASIGESNTDHILSWTVSVDDDGQGFDDVTNYKIYADGSLIATISSGSTTYTHTIPNSTTVGTYSVSAVDKYCGNESTLANVSGCDQNPEVAITYPSPSDPNTVSDTITVCGTASVPEGRNFTSLQIKVDNCSWNNTSGTTSWTYSWDTTIDECDVGSHTLTVKVVDDTGCYATNSVTVIVDNQSDEEGGSCDQTPTVNIVVPDLNATVSGNAVEISGTATVPDGRSFHSEGGVGGVYIKIDEGEFTPVTGTESWFYSWNSTAAEVTNGGHIITVKALDTADCSSDDTVNVNVSNCLQCNVYYCKQTGNNYGYLKLYVHDGSNPVTGASATSNVQLKVGISNTYSFDEIVSGWYGGEEDDEMDEGAGGDSCTLSSGTPSADSNRPARTKDKYISDPSITVTVNKTGYESCTCSP